MDINRLPDRAEHDTLLLVRRGRFADALRSIQDKTTFTHLGTHLQQSLLADLLQRTGNNREAEHAAFRYLGLNSTTPEASARCHFVIGNVSRERGDIHGAIGHFQTAAQLSDVDPELSCWIQLRLLAVVAELAGSQTAMARLTEVRRCLTRFGDPRPFAALHLWIAEVETTRGHLESARRHLRIAQSLLAEVDDVWLHGYFAINSFGVSYYSAEILNARRWAQVAIDCAKLSGHAGGRRAAHANLGHIEFSLGHPFKAEESFRLALECSEPGSASHFAILDSIAQIKLYLGHLHDCQTIVNQLEDLCLPTKDSEPNYCRAWALQTKIQLLLKQGRIREAKGLCDSLAPALPTISQPRIRAILSLLSAEALVANSEFEVAAETLGKVMLISAELPPDLLAETERLVANTLSLSGAPAVGTINFERAISTFDLIGHAIGKAAASSDASTFQPCSAQSIESFSVRSSLDRIRTLLETRTRPELFGLEAFKLLRDLGCARHYDLSTYDGSEKSEVLYDEESVDSTANQKHIRVEQLTISVGSSNQREFKLNVLPKTDSASILATMTFRRIIERILTTQTDNAEFTETEVLWSANERLLSDEVVFAADSMMDILRTIDKVANTNLSVLITGETGTGKEVIAKTLHDHSDRAAKPFIAVNCTAVPRELLESQLFGYRRGAFSGASEHFAGIIRGANGGTLLLDEIGDIPLEMQSKLLRFLESGEIHPLGESRPIKVNVRLLFATNASLEELIKQRRFREDLFFRINVIHIKIPPLRERREEIPLLVRIFAQRYSRELSKEPQKMATETIEQLILQSWPGNIRQLSNEVRRLVAISDSGAIITPDLLSSDFKRQSTNVKPKVASALPNVVVMLDQSLSNAVVQVERTMIERALEKSNGRVSVAAQMLGLSRKGLYLKRQRLGMPKGTEPQSVSQEGE